MFLATISRFTCVLESITVGAARGAGSVAQCAALSYGVMDSETAVSEKTYMFYCPKWKPVTQ